MNTADKEAAFFLRFPAGRYAGFRLERQEAVAALPKNGVEVIARNSSATAEGIQFSLGDTVFDSPLRGAFHIENALAAVATAVAIGVPLTACAAALRRIRNIPGRFEEISTGSGSMVVIDYAHTPEALRSVYTAAKQHWSHLVCVLGATGGGRDKWKRAALGKLAAEHCDSIVVADEDPYDEDPAAIRRGVMDGAIAAGGESRLKEIPDRRLAIREALAKAAPGGAVVITGKGSEPWMVVAHGKKVPWDDRKIAKEELARLSAPR
ncbi:MAG: hypothetical protein HY475_02440 [Candidatus Terrybacteria bacterium]|nr:hypothetical protein [Candidatus Terrybacteria bacterium]